MGVTMTPFDLKQCNVIIAEFLVEQRKRSNISQAELSEKLGKPQPWLSRVESGSKKISVATFVCLSRALGFDPAKALSTFATTCPVCRKAIKSRRPRKKSLAASSHVTR